MSIRALLVGPRGHGGEGVYVDSLFRHPPAGVEYDVSGDFHQSASGARCALVREIALNQIVHRLAIPDMGFRALRVREPFDLIHVHAHPILLSGRNRTPLVMSEGSSSAVYLAAYLGWDQQAISRAFTRARRMYRLLGVHDRLLALEHARKVYVFSRWARDINIHWGADPRKLEVIYPGFATPDPVDRSGRERFTFLFIGGDFERKGGFEVVEAFARVVAELPHASLVIAGSGPDSPNPDRLVHSWVPQARQQQARAALARLQRSGHVKQYPWLEHSRLRAEVFPAADAFVMPSHAEGFGFANVEAMSYGLPVITSTVGPAREIVSDAVTGLLIEPGNVDRLASAMMRVATDVALAGTMGTYARREFERRFTRRRFRQALGDLYRRTLEE